MSCITVPPATTLWFAIILEDNADEDADADASTKSLSAFFSQSSTG